MNSPKFLHNEGKSGIETFLKLITSMKIMEHSHNIYLDHLLAYLEEQHRKTIKAWRLLAVNTFHHLKGLTLFKRSL